MGGACAIIIKDYVVHTVPHMAVHISDMVLLFFQTRPDCASLMHMHVMSMHMHVMSHMCLHVAPDNHMQHCMCMCVYLRETHSLVWSGLLVSYAHVSGMHVSAACEYAVICMLFPAQTVWELPALKLSNTWLFSQVLEFCLDLDKMSLRLEN